MSATSAAPPRPRDLLAAVRFLTRLPCGRHHPADDLTRASAWFPAVGLVVAAVGIAVRAGLEPLVGPVPATVAAVLATVAVTGAFHEDGLADSADGLWGGATPQRRLEIMRDSRVGTYGTVAVTGDLALRFALLAPLPLSGLARAMVASHALGRLAPLVLVALLPAARPEGVVAGRLGAAGWALAGGTGIAVAAAAGGVWAPIFVCAGAAGTAAVMRVARVKVGGVTGDLLGAGVRVSALLVTAAVVALHRQGAW